MPGLLDNRYRGLLGSPSVRQVRVPGQPGMGGGMPFMGMGGGMDAGGMGQGGAQPSPYDPGAQIWRQLMQGLASQGMGALAPSNAGQVFSPELRAMLAPEYQPQKKGGK